VKGHSLLQKENFTTTKWNSISCIEEAQAAALEKFYYHTAMCACVEPHTKAKAPTGEMGACRVPHNRPGVSTR
jgi:hypothetical protein